MQKPCADAGVGSEKQAGTSWRGRHFLTGMPLEGTLYPDFPSLLAALRSLSVEVFSHDYPSQDPDERSFGFEEVREGWESVLHLVPVAALRGEETTGRFRPEAVEADPTVDGLEFLMGTPEGRSRVAKIRNRDKRGRLTV